MKVISLLECLTTYNLKIQTRITHIIIYTLNRNGGHDHVSVDQYIHHVRLYILIDPYVKFHLKYL
jgi:hypothetical protein